MEGHDQLVALELPHLVGDGLHLKEGVTAREKRHDKNTTQQPHSSTTLTTLQLYNSTTLQLFNFTTLQL